MTHEQAVDRARKLHALVERGATDGERAAAADRLKALAARHGVERWEYDPDAPRSTQLAALWGPVVMTIDGEPQPFVVQGFKITLG